VINIITKKGGDKPISFSQTFIADSSTHSLDWQTAIFGSYNGFNYRFSGSGINSGLRRVPDGLLELSDYKNNYFTGRVGYDWDGGSFYIKVDKYHSVIHIPSAGDGGLVLSSYGVIRNYTNVELELPKWDRQSISAGVELTDILPNLVKLRVDLYYQNMKKEFKNKITVYNYVPPFTPMSLHIGVNTFNDQDSIGGTVQSDWKFGDHYLITGLDYNKDDLSADDNRAPTIVQPPMGPPVVSTPAASYKYKAEQTNIGLFAQDEWTLPSNFTATFGLRNTWVKSGLKANNNPNLPNNTDKSDTKLVGNIGLVFTGIKNISLRAAWSQGYKFPPLNDLYLGTVHGSDSPTLPNPDLKPETSNNLEIGMRFNNGALNIDLAAFYAKSKNYITTAPVPGSLVNANQFVNTDRARTMGVELATSYEIYPLGLTPYATVTYIDRQITDTIQANSRFAATRTITYSTSNTGTSPWYGRLGFKFDRDLNNSFIFHSNVYMEWASAAKQTYYESTFLRDNGSGNPATYDYMGFVTDEEPGWQTYNVDLGLEWGVAHKWNATLSVRNIFDRQYTRSNNNNEDPGFHIVAGLGFEF
jgi:hemoglobin/transferrin/lactoferrin receptor protein